MRRDHVWNFFSRFFVRAKLFLSSKFTVIIPLPRRKCVTRQSDDACNMYTYNVKRYNVVISCVHVLFRHELFQTVIDAYVRARERVFVCEHALLYVKSTCRGSSLDNEQQHVAKSKRKTLVAH